MLKFRLIPREWADFKPLRVPDGFPGLINIPDIWNIMISPAPFNDALILYRKPHGGLPTKTIVKNPDRNLRDNLYLEITELPGRLESFKDSIRFVRQDNKEFNVVCVLVSITDFDLRIGDQTTTFYDFLLEKLVCFYFFLLFRLFLIAH